MGNRQGKEIEINREENNEQPIINNKDGENLQNGNGQNSSRNDQVDKLVLLATTSVHSSVSKSSIQ